MSDDATATGAQVPAPGAPARPDPWPSHALEAGFLLLALAMLAFSHRSPATRTFSLLFSSIVLEALPFMVLGACVGGLVEAFVSRERMAALLPQRTWLAILLAAGMGVFLPVCECAVVPVVRRLARKGLPLPVVVAYLLGTPIANPIVAASTAVAYQRDWPVVCARILLGYGIAVLIGLLMWRLYRGLDAFHASVRTTGVDPSPGGCRAGAGTSDACGGHAPPSSVRDPPSRLAEAMRHASADLVGVGKYFVIGAFIAALAQTFVDRALLAGVTRQPVAAILLMMLLAVALNLCSEADAFVASSFRGFVPMSAQLAFLLLGPILDLKLLLMYQTLFRRRVILTLATLMLVAVLAAGLGLHATGRFS